MTDLDEMLLLAQGAAESAGALLMARASDAAVVTVKSPTGDVATDLDHACEDLIIDLLTAARPGDGYLAEERGESLGTSGVRWVVDPLDGTGNYLRGYPAFAVSVAAEIDGVTVVGVVHDPSRGETFTAITGRGARSNDKSLGVSARTVLSESVIGTGLGHDHSRRPWQLTALTTVAAQAQDVRSSGSAALDLCWTAAGRLDAYYEADTRIWDRLAGALIVTEAGGLVTGPDGRASDALTVAGPPELAGVLAALLDGVT